MLDPFMTGNVPGFIKRQNNVDKRPFLTIFTTFEMKFTVLLSTSSSCQKLVNLKNALPVNELFLNTMLLYEGSFT